jgi:hypothetical protein
MEITERAELYGSFISLCQTDRRFMRPEIVIDLCFAHTEDGGNGRERKSDSGRRRGGAEPVQPSAGP